MAVKQRKGPSGKEIEIGSTKVRRAPSGKEVMVGDASLRQSPSGKDEEIGPLLAIYKSYQNGKRVLYLQYTEFLSGGTTSTQYTIGGWTDGPPDISGGGFSGISVKNNAEGWPPGHFVVIQTSLDDPGFLDDDPLTLAYAAGADPIVVGGVNAPDFATTAITKPPAIANISDADATSVYVYLFFGVNPDNDAEIDLAAFSLIDTNAVILAAAVIDGQLTLTTDVSAVGGKLTFHPAVDSVACSMASGALQGFSNLPIIAF